MKKLVNGRVINIDNIALFELAAEGLALQSTAISATSDGIDGKLESPMLKKYIKQYDVFFKSMPYPLYAIEDDIKYATLGNFIQTLSREHVDMWVDKGLHIKLDADTGMTLKIVNNTWSIHYCKDTKQDNTDLELFKDSIGYTEYKWILNKIINKETTANFYTEFMPDFVKACNNQPMVLKWELENILTFGSIPARIDLRENKILNIKDNKEYTLDIFCTGSMESSEAVQTWSLSNNTGNTGIKYKRQKIYSFDLYEKPMSDYSRTSGKLEKCKITGIHNLFMELCGIKNSLEMNSFPTFYGVIADTNLIFTIDKRLFVAKSNRLSESKDIAHGVELYSVDRNKVYFIKSKRISEQISKDILYSYNIADGSIRMCKIVFSY